MNKPIRTMAIACMLLFVALMLNATWLQYVEAGDLNDDAGNRRVTEAAFARERGPIVVGRQQVAESVDSDDEFDFQRIYKQPLKYAHLTGFFSYSYGSTGVERTENEILSGDDSRLFVDRVVDMLGNAQPKGGSVKLTIDADAQTAAYDGLAALGDNVKGAVVALEPSTGRILAIVSSPTFDPNLIADHDIGEASTQYDELIADQTEPMLNRAISTTLPPGSTFKLVTAATALESGQYTPESPVPGGSSFTLPNTTTGVGNSNGGSCGGDQITMAEALKISCNVSFLSLADELGDDALREQAEAFGFGQSYLDDLPNQAESVYPANPNPAETALSGIGQTDVAATPLQMAMVAAGIGNNGTVMTPYLVDEVRSPDLDVLSQTDEIELSEAVSSGTARDLTEMMVATVGSGTANPAAIPGVEVAGKTGTAQSADDRPPYAWFVSFAPADDPQVAVAVMIEEAEVARSEIAGGRLGGPIAKTIMQAVIG